MKRLIIAVLLTLSIFGCKKIDEKDRQHYVNQNGEISKGSPSENSTILMKYTHPSPISDIYVVCVEGQKIGISDTGSLVKLDYVSGKGIQSCN